MTTLSPTSNRLDAERAELEAVLASNLFGRTSNPVRFLNFVCEKYFAGETEAIKEYSIAVEALGRPADFDPQSDTIVRVTAHALRKKLEDFYRSEGADHSIQICLPPGRYIPRFVHQNSEETPNEAMGERDLPFGNGSPVRNGIQPYPQEAKPLPDRAKSGRPGRVIVAIGIVIVAAISVAALWILRHREVAVVAQAVSSNAQSAPAAAALDRSVHILIGENRVAYTDRAGFTWQPDRFCSGGSSFSTPERAIHGTEDPALFLSGRSGAFQCRIPVAPGSYQVHILFAETAGLQENARNVAFSINGGPAVNLDVVDDAAGNDVATVKVFPDIRPQNDGAIHLEFVNSQSFVNAIEIVPSSAGAVLPVRLVTGHTTFRDRSGNIWLPDRYAFGGRLSRSSGDLSRIADGGLYEWQRIGHFRYVIPVAPGRPYILKLYFREPWFGSQNGNPGGVGSRIFDVSCNGSMLLKNFDILREAGSEPIVRIFEHIQPTAQGKIEISFTPVVNYPSVNALEVIPE